MATMDQEQLAEWIVESITQFVLTAAGNDLGLAEREKAFDKPLVGFSSGADPLYAEFKKHIGSFYLTPRELFLASSDSEDLPAQNLTVISWILPSTAKTRQEQSGQSKYPSERWARTRAMGEDFNNDVRRFVVDLLMEAGIQAAAPLLSPAWKRSEEGTYAPCSNWSERHAAYTAGLGAFGLCDGLITAVGKAVRIGSVVARTRLTPSARIYEDHHANCLHFTHGSCGKCIPRCPVQALGKDGHDKWKCMQYTEKAMNAFIRKNYGINTYACGLCQADVPCMDHIPTPDEG